jgi:DNA-directed RNA polymerase sigma subunit (sigma70/sigma32)
MTGIPKGGMKPTVVSMSAPVGDEMDLTFGDTLPDRGTLPDEFAACREQLRGLHPKTDIERRVLLGRAEGHTFGDIGASLGCSGTWARCILDKVTDSMSPP